MALTSYRTL